MKNVSLLSFCMAGLLAVTPATAFAASEDYSDETGGGSISVEVVMDTSSTWNVAIPDVIEMDINTKKGAYDIEVTGKIPVWKMVQVAPVNTDLTFTAVNREDTLSATLKQDKKYIEGNLLSNDAEHPSIISGSIKLNADDIPSGNWKADIEFTVDVKTEAQVLSVPGLYDGNYNLLATYAQSLLKIDKDYYAVDDFFAAINSKYQYADSAGYLLLNEKYPDTKIIVLPDTITWIGSYSFADCNKIEKIIIPTTVTDIHKNAFQNCTNLTINIPETVTSIGTDVFLNVKEVNYE